MTSIDIEVCQRLIIVTLSYRKKQSFGLPSLLIFLLAQHLLGLTLLRVLIVLSLIHLGAVRQFLLEHTSWITRLVIQYGLTELALTFHSIDPRGSQRSLHKLLLVIRCNFILLGPLLTRLKLHGLLLFIGLD